VIIDSVVILLLIFFVVSGWRTGFISSLLGLVGFFGGGVFGLFLAERFFDGQTSFFRTVLLYLVIIFLTAELFQYLFKKIGLALRKIAFPLKWVDSLTGAALGAVKTLFIIYIVSSLLALMPSNGLALALQESRGVSEIQDRAPELLDKLFSQRVKN